MLVAVVKELKQGEGRVACTPENVRKLTDAGHKVIVEKNAGIGSGFSNDMYEKEGAKIVTHEQAWEADLVIKVKYLMKANINISKRIKLSGDFYI